MRRLWQNMINNPWSVALLLIAGFLFTLASAGFVNGMLVFAGTMLLNVFANIVLVKAEKRAGSPD